MFSIHSKFLSLLQPYLLHPPNLTINLGLLRSHITVTDLHFDANILNQLLLHNGAGICFHQFIVDVVEFSVSVFGGSGVSVEVIGVHVRLKQREVSDERRRMEKTRNERRDKERKELLSMIDPEGVALHDAVERISAITSARNSLAVSVMNVLLTRLRVEMHDIRLEFQLPSMDDLFVFSKMKELSLHASHSGNSCLLKGFVGALLVPNKLCSLDLDASDWEIGLKKEGNISCIFSSSDLSSKIKLKDLKLLDLGLRAPQVYFMFSPADLHFLLVYDMMPSEEVKRGRNGRQLWNIVANSLAHLLSSRKFSLHKVVGLVCLWQRHVRAYKSLLILVQYSPECIFMNSSIRMSQDKTFSTLVKQQWDEVSKIERELPVLALTQSRKTARYKAKMHVQPTTRSSSEPQKKVHGMILGNILLVLHLIWKAICFILQSLTHILSVRGLFDQHQENDGQSGILSKGSTTRYSLSLGYISLTMSPEDVASRTARGKSVSNIHIPHFNLLSFCAIINTFCFIYVEGNSSRSLFFSCEDFKVRSSSSVFTATEGDKRKEKSLPFKGRKEGTSMDSMVVVQSEPALESLGSLDLEEVDASSSKFSGSTWFFHLGGYLEELWSSCKQSHKKIEEIEGQHPKNPFLFCEIKNFLVDPCPHRRDYGLSKFSLSMGKLNFDLRFSTVMSLSLLLMQMNHSFGTSYANTERASNSSDIMEESKGFKLEDTCKVYENKVKLTLLRLIPEKNIELGIVIDGPNIRISLHDEGLHGSNEKYTSNNGVPGHRNLYIALDLKNIIFAVWPTHKDAYEALTTEATSDDKKLKYPRLKKPQPLDILKTELTHDYDTLSPIKHEYFLMVKELNCYLEDVQSNQRSQVFSMKSVVIHSSSCRESFHSLTTPVTALSISLGGMTTVVAIFLFMDEILVLFQVVQHILLSSSYACTSLNSAGGLHFRETIKKHDTFSGEEMNGSYRVVRGKILSLVLDSTDMSLDFTYDMKSLDIIVHSSRLNQFSQSNLKRYRASSKQKLTIPDVAEYGIKISIQNSHIQVSWDNEQATTIISLLGMQNLLFNEYRVGVLPDNSFKCIYECSLSDCNFNVWARSNMVAVSSERMNGSDDSPSTGLSETLNVKFGNSDKNLEHYDVLVRISFGKIFVGEPRLKNILSESCLSNKHLSEISVIGDFRKISWALQGGLLVIQTTAFARYVCCFNDYFLFLANLSSEHTVSVRQSKAVVPDNKSLKAIDYLRRERSVSTTSSSSLPDASNTSPLFLWKMFEALQIRLSQLLFVLLVAETPGEIWELVLDVELYFNLELTNSSRKLVFDLSRIAVFSELHHDSNVEVELSSKVIVPSRFNNTSSSHSAPTVKSSMENKLSVIIPSNEENYILKHVAASLAIEKVVTREEMVPLWFNDDWIGTGSVAGFDVTISLCEIQMLMLLVAPLTGLLKGETASYTEQSRSSVNQDNYGFEDAIPDGAIVAIQDLHQHMYIAVEAVENKYQLIGAVHYSLVGEKALFKVKYCTKKRWGSHVPWFTLISLHANSDFGEPLLLNCGQGSSFVDLSSIEDKDKALWKMVSYKPESYEADSNLETYNPSSKHTFFLVNKNSDRGIAFVDGVLEFVKKPGNPIKVKLFKDSDLLSSIQRLNTPSTQATYTPYISVTIEKVNLTIVHKVSDANDLFPLLRMCIDTNQFTVQVRPAKVRHMSRFTAAVLHFDSQRHLWREIIQPVEMYIFYRSKITSPGLELVSQGVPNRFFFGIKQVDIFLSELSLDIILFIIGELNLAGPFAVRKSTIFANYCKVENRSGLSLHCQFNDNQEATIAEKQSASIFLRRMTFTNRPPETSSSVSVQLSTLEAISTSPIHVSLLNDRVLAWRTRIVSSRDKRTFPGPFVVVDISRRTKDGLSIVVSPLLRIHNETGFSMELRFRRPQQKETDVASVTLQSHDMIDDSVTALNAINSTGGSKKAFMSFSLGSSLFSFRPNIPKDFGYSGNPDSIGWSEDLKGGKAVRLSGLFDKLNYSFRKAFSVESLKYSLSSVHCSSNAEDTHVTDLHFLIQTIGRDVPVIHPDSFGDSREIKTSPVALQEQKEIFLLPTVRVSNHLESEIHVLLTEALPDVSNLNDVTSIGKQATIQNGSSAYLYGNPAMMYFTVTLTAFSSKCKPVNSGDWVKKLSKQKKNVHSLDIDLDFGAGKYYASLRLSRGDRGMLEAAVFTAYILKNDSDLALFCFASNHKTLSREEAKKFGSNLPPELGLLLPPKSKKSWFLKSSIIQVKLADEKSSLELLDLDALSGFTELSLESHNVEGVKLISKLGVSLKPYMTEVAIPSQIVLVAPRYIILNESQESVCVRQCYLEDDRDGIMTISSKQKVALHTRTGIQKKGESNFFDSLLKKHRNSSDDSLIFIQFRLNEVGWDWSGPICVASLGRFFLKFRRTLETHGLQSDQMTEAETAMTEFAVVHVTEESSTLVLKYQKKPSISLPYRIENSLRDTSLTYYQKDSLVPDTLGSGKVVDYVWDNLNLPHKLVVQITNMNLLREINMDKVCAWRPFFKVRQQRGLALNLPLDAKLGTQRKAKDEMLGLDRLKVGYEVYADGPTRVLRISEFPGRHEDKKLSVPSSKTQFRVTFFAVHFMENKKKDLDSDDSSCYYPIIIARFGNISLDSMFTNQNNYNQIRIQSLIVDEKWTGAPFAAMLRRNQLDYSSNNENVLQMVFVLLPTNSNVKQVQYLSMILQPIDLNIDEETLMRLVSFWRTSLSVSNTPSRQFYFKHFEIHPIKIVASFLPGSSDSNYSSSQETLRALLHSVIKIPTLKKKGVELNGILVTHALVTMRELLIKCAQHYSWYGMRAIYIAKGSRLLPPAFASIFDDSASSSLDVFFDPSSGVVNLPGLTLGMFKFVSTCIDKKGFSGTKRYFGDLSKTVKTAGSNVLFAALTEISDCVLRGAEANGFNGMLNGFHQGILKLAMEPSVLGTAAMEGGPDRKIKLDQSPGVDELYIEGYLQAMLDSVYQQEYLRVRVIDNQVVLKNLPPSNSLITEIMDRVKGFLISKGLLKGELSTSSHPLRYLRGENEWKFGPTILTLWEHLFVSFAIRRLRKEAFKFMAGIKAKEGVQHNIDEDKSIVPVSSFSEENRTIKFNMKQGIRKFVLSGIVAYIDGRLCRCIPNMIARRIVSGFMLSLLEKNDGE